MVGTLRGIAWTTVIQLIGSLALKQLSALMLNCPQRRFPGGKYPYRYPARSRLKPEE